MAVGFGRAGVTSSSFKTLLKRASLDLRRCLGRRRHISSGCSNHRSSTMAGKFFFFFSPSKKKSCWVGLISRVGGPVQRPESWDTWW